MSALIVFRSPREGDAEKMAPLLGLETLASMASVNMEPVKAIADSFRLSSEHTCWVAVEDGAPICAWGVLPMGTVSLSARIWCIATPRVRRHPKLMWRENKRFVAFCLERWVRLEAFCHVDFHTSQRWLRRLGFTLYEPVGGFPFCAAVLER
jgi:hypothetical protein